MAPIMDATGDLPDLSWAGATSGGRHGRVYRFRGRRLSRSVWGSGYDEEGFDLEDFEGRSDGFQDLEDFELGATDFEADEWSWLKKAWKGIRRAAKKAAPIAKRLAPVAGTIVGGALGGLRAPCSAQRLVDLLDPSMTTARRLRRLRRRHGHGRRDGRGGFPLLRGRKRRHGRLHGRHRGQGAKSHRCRCDGWRGNDHYRRESAGRGEAGRPDDSFRGREADPGHEEVAPFGDPGQDGAHDRHEDRSDAGQEGGERQASDAAYRQAGDGETRDPHVDQYSRTDQGAGHERGAASAG